MAEAKDKRTCFIIMPISTPNPEVYGGDRDHFGNVLNKLFVPAIERAGLVPIPPSAEGGDIIQASIIERLASADLVLCDMSTLNGNVLFELGVRTALNLPSCLVQDSETKKVLFDTSAMNRLTYDPVPTWSTEEQIEALHRHLVKTLDKSNGVNSMWKHFGTEANAADLKASGGDLAELMDLRFAALSAKVDAISQPTSLRRGRSRGFDDLVAFSVAESLMGELVLEEFTEALEVSGYTEVSLSVSGRELRGAGATIGFRSDGPFSFDRLASLASEWGLEFVESKDVVGKRILMRSRDIANDLS